MSAVSLSALKSGYISFYLPVAHLAKKPASLTEKSYI
jgi:hypothetical protein